MITCQENRVILKTANELTWIEPYGPNCLRCRSTRNSRISREKFEGLMLNTGEMASDVGSVIYGEEAVAKGLIDQVGTLAEALDWLHGQIGPRPVS